MHKRQCPSFKYWRLDKRQDFNHHSVFVECFHCTPCYGEFSCRQKFLKTAGILQIVNQWLECTNRTGKWTHFLRALKSGIFSTPNPLRFVHVAWIFVEGLFILPARSLHAPSFHQCFLVSHEILNIHNTFAFYLEFPGC